MTSVFFLSFLAWFGLALHHNANAECVKRISVPETVKMHVFCFDPIRYGDGESYYFALPPGCLTIFLDREAKTIKPHQDERCWIEFYRGEGL